MRLVHVHTVRVHSNHLTLLCPVCPNADVGRERCLLHAHLCVHVLKTAKSKVIKLHFSKNIFQTKINAGLIC